MFDQNQSPNQRLTHFRSLRRQHHADPSSILQYFCDQTVLPRYLDFYTPSSWPNVFDIVSEGYFCQSGITLIITSLMLQAGFTNTTEVTLEAVSNDITGHQGLVLVDQDQVYNFIPGETVTLEYMRDHSITLDIHIIKPDNLFH